MAALWALGACAGRGPGGSARATSLGNEPVVLSSKYVTAVYADHQSTETSFYLSDVPLSQLLTGEVVEGQVLQIDLFWIPKAGDTPMDRSATNASIRYVMFSGGEVGIYGGAGFVLLRGKRGRPTVRLSLRDASLTLLKSTDGFVDLLSPARLTGSFTAAHDERQVREIRIAVSRMIAEAQPGPAMSAGASRGP